MKPTNAHLHSFSTTLEQHLSVKEYNALLTNAHDLHYIASGVEMEGYIPDTKPEVQGLLNDYEQFTGKKFFQNTALLWLLLVCFAMYEVLYLHPYPNTDVSVLPAVKSTEHIIPWIETESNFPYHDFPI